MKLKQLNLKNFRAYQEIRVNFDEDLTVIIGQNDIGKSTILEALDIFFGQEVVKIDITDLNIYARNNGDNYIIISCSFEVDENFKLVIDAINKTSLKDEYLLNKDGLLEIFKIFEVKETKVAKEKIFLRAKYPSIYEKPLVNLKISDLKKKLEEISNEIENYKKINKTISAEIRKALYNYYIKEDTEFNEINIDLQKEEGKNIWSSLQKELPLYFLFQSDRQNKDTDLDIQNPLRVVTKQIVYKYQEQFEELKNKIEKELEDIGKKTIEKMRDMGLNIANDLKPIVNNKNWDSLFSFTLESDDGISLNKRGSGFRRMVLLNYFRAEAERKANEKNNKNIIYAFEEPETAQHPNHQKILINSLIKLSQEDNYQVILTTHTPEIAKMVREENLIVIVKNNDNFPKVISDNEEKIEKIIDTLGVLPNISIENVSTLKVVVCTEGYTDIEFLKNINQIEEYKKIVDLNSREILLLFLGGGTLEHYVNKKYLDKLGIPQVHIYDSDINQKNEKNKHKYKKIIDKINKSVIHYSFETKKAELENYIHPDIIKEHYEFDTIYHQKEENWLKIWSEELDIPKYVKKNKTNTNKAEKKDLVNLSKKLTKDYLIELDAYDEIKSWFEKIKELMG
jgi:predicted ATP-dependent endonuclease of OLD family